MKPAAANSLPRKAARAKHYRLEELSPRLKRELLRLKLRDDFSQFDRLATTTTNAP